MDTDWIEFLHLHQYKWNLYWIRTQKRLTWHGFNQIVISCDCLQIMFCTSCQGFLLGRPWHLSGNVWTDPSTLQVLTFPAEWGVVVVKVGCSQLLLSLSGNQLSPQRHTLILNFPIKSNPWHTLATLDTMSCECGTSEQTQITPAKFSKDSGPLPSLLPLLSPLSPSSSSSISPLPSQLRRGHLFPLSSISRWQDVRCVESGQRRDHLSAQQYGRLLFALNLACCTIIIQDKTKL